METKEIQEKLKAASYFSRDNVDADVYDGLSKLRALLCERGEDDPHLLNKGNVIAIWYLTGLTYDGNPQLIIRKHEDCYQEQQATRGSLLQLQLILIFNR